MKTIQSTIVIFIAVIFATSTLFSSCSKDEDAKPQQQTQVVYESEDFYDGFITKAVLPSFVSVEGNPDFFEIGLVFKPLVKGKINKFFLKTPTQNIMIRVTLWDKTTKAVLKSINCGMINYSYGEFTFNEIQLEKNKEYVISMNANKYNNYAGVGNIAYPITSGNIQVLDYVTNFGNSQTFPEISTNNESVNGKVSFNFIRTE